MKFRFAQLALASLFLLCSCAKEDQRAEIVSGSDLEQELRSYEDNVPYLLSDLSPELRATLDLGNEHKRSHCHWGTNYGYSEYGDIFCQVTIYPHQNTSFIAQTGGPFDRNLNNDPDGTWTVDLSHQSGSSYVTVWVRPYRIQGVTVTWASYWYAISQQVSGNLSKSQSLSVADC